MGTSLSNSMSGKNNRLRAPVLGSAERCCNGVRCSFVLGSDDGARVIGTVSRCRLAQEVLERVVVLPSGEIEHLVLGRDSNGNFVFPTIGRGGIVRLGQWPGLWLRIGQDHGTGNGRGEKGSF